MFTENEENDKERTQLVLQKQHFPNGCKQEKHQEF